jgi:hypothetical protein
VDGRGIVTSDDECPRRLEISPAGPSFRTPSHGENQSSFTIMTSTTPVFLLWHPISEPIRHDTARLRARSTSHPVAPRGLHQYPACGGPSSGEQNHSSSRDLRPWASAVRSTGSTRTYFSRKITIFVSVGPQAFFISAPSMTTPEVTYFQSATSSLRANATIVGFLRPPPLVTRSLNQRLSAVSG